MSAALLPHRVDQTTFGCPGGNCFSACVASILGLGIEAVPYFMGDEEWYESFARWLAPHGLYPLCFKLGDGWRPAGLHILSGRSPRGDWDHAVVACGAEVLHDPHPSRDGILSHHDVVLLVPFAPAVLVREASS